MNRNPVVVACLMLMACGAKASLPAARNPSLLAGLTCAPDSSEIRYTDITSDSTTGDLSGFEIRLTRAGASWTGTSREASGELATPQSLAAIQVDSVTGQVSFTIPNGTDSSTFQGTISCDSLYGSLRAYRTVEPVGVAFRRKTP